MDGKRSGVGVDAYRSKSHFYTAGVFSNFTWTFKVNLKKIRKVATEDKVRKVSVSIV